jgi:hypothetical protein
MTGFAAEGGKGRRRAISPGPGPEKDQNMDELFSDLYGSKYLAAADVKQPFTTSIGTVDVVDFARAGERPKKKVTLVLKGVAKAVVLNRTNADNLRDAFGENFRENWLDKNILVKAEPTQYGGRRVMGLRLYPATARTAHDFNDDLPEER